MDLSTQSFCFTSQRDLHRLLPRKTSTEGDPVVSMQSRVLRACLTLVGALAAAPAFAGFITIDFDAETRTSATVPYLEDGFRLTPNCHWDVSNSGNPNGSNWFGWDSSGCDTQPATMRLDRGGAAFDLIGMELMGEPIFRADSSRGG